ncbi:hypothetical protein Pint_06484 [Pistacia integerrima]|uniref:Uncharacterized protein n=2 Tax=Pistacia TaxID=55512 RepID=A0ACC1BUP4_9ROSI|nr:hypothetical protein Pint_06484 [Pistacia integerrima]KAJ0102761.1 hypothetical protein Patl1_06591 [Pistacia atlantica]
MKVTKGKGVLKKERKEVLKPVEDRTLGKRKAALKAVKSSNKRTKNAIPAKKDPNKPKRPPSAFFVFLEEFRKVYKQEHPNIKAVSAVGKAGGEKWKSLTDSVSADKTLHRWLALDPTTNQAQLDEKVYAPCLSYLILGNLQEKAPYEAKAAKRKSEYEKLMIAYNKKQESTDDDDDGEEEEEQESEKSKPELHDDYEEEEEEDEEDDEDED